MRQTVYTLLCALGCTLALAGCGGDGDGEPATDAGPRVDANTAMSFFVTSEGNGEAGGDYGGLAGADARCQSLADAAGAGGRTWRAYLSTDDIGVGPVEDARDRIGQGPWFNVSGLMVAADLDALHRDGIDQSLMLDERGETIPRTEHDILTGSDADGRLRFRENGDNATCLNWTSPDNPDYAWVGHYDLEPSDWNTSHESRCSEAGMIGVNGAGRLYCFAID